MFSYIIDKYAYFYVLCNYIILGECMTSARKEARIEEKPKEQNIRTGGYRHGTEIPVGFRSVRVRKPAPDKLKGPK